MKKKSETYYVLIIASVEGEASYLSGILKKGFLCWKEVGKDDLEDPFQFFVCKEELKSRIGDRDPGSLGKP